MPPLFNNYSEIDGVAKIFILKETNHVKKEEFCPSIFCNCSVSSKFYTDRRTNTLQNLLQSIYMYLWGLINE
jgi:hypothetical protein